MHFQLFNPQGRMSAWEIIQALAIIPGTVTSLDLGNNYLGNKTEAELTQIFAAIPATVTLLYLSSNNLDRKTGAELAQIFAALPLSITSLGLRGNHLGNKAVAEIVQALTFLPVSVINLDLGFNLLETKTGAELAQIFAAFPTSVTYLYLNSDNLGRKTEAELTQAFAALPRTITNLDLSWNNLRDEQLAVIIKALPSGIEVIALHDKTIHTDAFYANQLKTEVGNLCSKKGIEQLRFDILKLALEIDESRLIRFIKVLEEQNDPLADLTCGLLLEGQISTTADIIDNCNAYDEYMEKRSHDAISFYTKAAEGKAIMPIVEFLLWEMKTLNPIPSVQNRLSHYDLTPQSTCETFNQISKTRPSVSMPLYTHLRLFNSSQESESGDEFTTLCSSATFFS